METAIGVFASRDHVAEIKNDTLLVNQLHGQLPKVTEVQEAVRNGKCQELPGIDGPSEP
jgi:hypothetical protein